MYDKRSAIRLTKSLDVDCRTLDTHRVAVPARISDVSPNGAFLDSMNPLPVGTQLGLRFAVGEHLFVVAAEVVHRMPQFGMGVRFTNLNPESRCMLAGALQHEA
jgi:hypothetical protein